ncbi:MAG: hypothetical protein ACJ796_20455 [Gemmatimonadaceae bacterium]
MSSGAKSGKLGRGDGAFDLASYAPVAERITRFYETFPRGRIITELVSRTERDVVFRALVYRDANDTDAAATGWAAEREGDSEINSVACLENTETSAIGRALANLGFTASRERPSAEEMAKVSRARVRARVDSRTPDDVADLLALLKCAERLGMRSSRVASIRRVLTENASAAAVQSWTRVVRRWVRKRRDDGLRRAWRYDSADG